MILLRIWPALIPLLLYLVWLYYRKKRVGHEDEMPPVELFRGPLFWSLVASLVLLLISLLFFGVAQPTKREGQYVPPHFEGGKISPSRIDTP